MINVDAAYSRVHRSVAAAAGGACRGGGGQCSSPKTMAAMELKHLARIEAVNGSKLFLQAIADHPTNSIVELLIKNSELRTF